MINIQINGEIRQVKSSICLEELIGQLGHAGKRIAVELNGTIVRRDQHAQTSLHDGDQLEVVVAIGGG